MTGSGGKYFGKAFPLRSDMCLFRDISSDMAELETGSNRDIQVMLSAFPVKEVAAIINAAWASFKSEIYEASLILPQGRREQIRQAGARLDALR